MLTFLGAFLVIIAIAVFLLTKLDNSVGNDDRTPYWPTAVIVLLSALCFVARHFVHGSIGW